MPNTTKPGAVIFAKQLERLATFYQALLALPVTHTEADHVILESDGFELVIHAIPAHIADNITITEPPEVREGTAVKLVFPVASLVAARLAAAGFGGALNPMEREWTGGGYRACDGHDPEGNVFQLRQRAA